MSEYSRSNTTIGKQTKSPPRGVKGLPILGNLPDFARDPLDFLLRQQALGDVVNIRLGPRRMYQVNHPAGVQHVLQEHNQNYSKEGFKTDFIKLVVGDGLITSDGSLWLHQRRLMQPAFHRQQIQEMTSMMVQAAKRELRGWEAALKSGDPVDISAAMMHLTLDIANRALFSTDIDAVAGDELNQIAKALTVITGDVSYRYERPFYPLWAPTARNRRYKDAVNTLNGIINRIIHNRRALLKADPDAAPADLLTTLMTARDADTGEGMSDRQLRDEVTTLFFAGHETTAITLIWAWVLLARHPEVEARLHAEVDQSLNGRLPTYADLEQLPYTRMIIDETLRLYPAAWLTNRMAVNEDVICGYAIPAGAFITLSPYATHHHPDFWPQPEKFEPERFDPARKSERHPYAYFPFGAGPRLCLGRSMALVEAPLILATIAQHYRLCLDASQPVVPWAAATLRTRQPVSMYLFAR